MSTLTGALELFSNSSSPLVTISKMADKAATKLLKASGATGALNKELKDTDASAKPAVTGLSKFAKLSSVISNAKKGMRIADDYINLQTRLNSVNDGLQTQAQLQEKVFAAANRSRGSYSDMVGTFTNLQATAGDTFGSNSETLGFAELMQKSFKLGGADTATQSSGMDQLTQAMGSGTIDSGAFDAITTNAPMMLQAMETFTGKSKAELQSMAEEGTLTADMLKNALFASSGDITNEFSKMPMTFTEIWDRIKNVALQAFGGVIEGISNIINSGGFQTLLDAVIVGIYTVGSVLDWIVDKFDYFVPILEFISGVLLVALIENLWKAAAAAWATVTPWLIAHWSILLIIAGIVAVIAVLGAMGVTVQSVFSFIGGAISVLIAWFNNIPVVISNIGTWISKTIDDFITKTVNKVIEGINKVISAINNIMGTDFKLLDEYQSSTSGMEYKELKSYSDAYKEGSQKGNDLYTGMNDKISDFTNGFGLGSTDGFTGIPDGEDLGTSNNPLTVQGVGSNGTLGVDMGEEDIQYLRDIAEREYVNQFSAATLAPNIKVSFGDIHEEADADKVAGRIQRILQEQIATASEGAY